jgi:ABC-type spermidine/putrescine transport system permease subunit II
MSELHPVNPRPTDWGKWLLGGASLLTYLFLYLPVIIVILYSFNETKVSVWPIQRYTFDWYRELRNDNELIDAVKLSVRVALVAAISSMILGTLGALALDRYKIRFKPGIRFLIVLPITLPGVVTGIALLAYFSLSDKPLSYWSTEFMGYSFPWPLIIAHITFSITLVLSTVAARLFQMPRYLDEASADLGASPFRTFRKITLPLIFPAMLSGGILAFTLSFDEVVVSLFLKGRENTLPLLIWGRLRLGLSPEINAVATVITIVSLAGILASTLLLGKAFWTDEARSA